MRVNFSWTFVGNAVYAAGQWAILSLLAKLGGSEMLGQYALALAVSAPIVMLAHLNLRAVLATDVSQRHPMGDYLALRIVATTVALILVGCAAILTGDNWWIALVIVAVGVGQASETVSDLCYGAMQRRERMDAVAISMGARTLVSVTALGVTLLVTGALLPSVIALAAGRLAVLLVYDLRIGMAGENLTRTGMRAPLAIFRTALPLGLVLMLISLNTNLPRYAIEYFQGSAELGVFAAVVSFITIGSTFVNALGQSATARMARHFNDREFRQFRRLILGMSGVVFALGLAGVAAATLFGGLVLRLLYRPEYADYAPLLVAVMGAGAFSYLAIALGYGVTSARVFDAQLPLFALAAAICGGASWLLVPPMGLYGAVVALAIAAIVQIAGQLAILGWALRRQESAA